MALKRQNDMLATFSMASLTDVIFLLLVFFMATSTFVFPTAVEVNLPQSSEQTSSKPLTRVYVDSLGVISAAYADGEVQQFTTDDLGAYLQTVMAQDTTQHAVAVYADKAVEYGKVVDVLNVGTKAGVKMVLATRAN